MFPIQLTDLANKIHAKLHGNGKIIITGLSSIEDAKVGHITFLATDKLRNILSSCQAAAVILTENNLIFCKIPALIVQNPYLTYAKIARLIYSAPKPNQGFGENSVIAANVIYGKRVSIGANSIIETGVILGDDVIIGAGNFIGKNTQIGTGTQIWPNVTIYHETNIGQHCLIQSGTVIGSDGFGYANDHGTWIKIPHLGKVVIGNHVEIGACTTIDRGTLNDTHIRNGVIIDNQCQIAHNVNIGENTAIAGGVIIAGSVNIGSHCMIGGASVINGHIKIYDKVIITGMSMVMRSITQPGVYSSGIPLQPNKIWRKTAALVMNINKICKRIKVIEHKLTKIFF